MRYPLRALILLELTLLRRVWQEPGLSQKVALLWRGLSGGGLALSSSVWGFLLMDSLQKFTARGRLNADQFELSLLVLLSALSGVWMLFPLLNVLREPPQQLTLYKLRIYPLSFRMLYNLRAVSVLLSDQNLKYYGVLLGAVASLVTRQGAGVLAPALLHTLLFAAGLSLWSEFCTIAISSLVLRPRGRQYLSILIFLLMPALIVVLPLSENLIVHPENWLLFLSETVLQEQFAAPLRVWQCFFPPGLFSQALHALWQGQHHALLPIGAALFGWGLLAHLLGTIVLRDLYADPPTHSAHHPLFRHLRLPGPDRWTSRRALMIRKDMRVLLRSPRDRIVFIIWPLSIAVIAILMPAGQPAHAKLPELPFLLLTLDYLFLAALTRLTRLFSLDGLGLRFYLLAPLPLRELLLTRLSAFGLLLGAEFLAGITLWITLGRPLQSANLLFLSLSFLTLTAALLTLGSLLSIRFPEALESAYESPRGRVPLKVFFPVVGLILSLPGLILGLARATGQSPALLMAALLLLIGWSCVHLFEFCAALLAREKFNLLEQTSRAAD